MAHKCLKRRGRLGVERERTIGVTGKNLTSGRDNTKKEAIDTFLRRQNQAGGVLYPWKTGKKKDTRRPRLWRGHQKKSHRENSKSPWRLLGRLPAAKLGQKEGGQKARSVGGREMGNEECFKTRASCRKKQKKNHSRGGRLWKILREEVYPATKGELRREH